MGYSNRELRLIWCLWLSFPGSDGLFEQRTPLDMVFVAVLSARGMSHDSGKRLRTVDHTGKIGRKRSNSTFIISKKDFFFMSHPAYALRPCAAGAGIFYIATCQGRNAGEISPEWSDISYSEAV